MNTKETSINKMCSFYASEFHLEMIMLPYINRKIKEGANIIIMTEKSLKETMEIVVAKVQLPKENKKKILEIDWNANDCAKLKLINEINGQNETIIFVIGNENYINNVNKNLGQRIKTNRATVVNCYNLKDIENKFEKILSEHSKILNTLEEKEIMKNY
jgi:predicted Zn-dependent protease